MNKFLPGVLLPFSLLIVLFCSCTTKRKLTYFQNHEVKRDSIPEYKYHEEKYVLCKGDIVGVELKGTLPEGFSFFNFRTDWKDPYTEASIFANNFTIDKDGQIVLPIIGELHLANKTVEDACLIIQMAVDEHFTNVQSYVKLFSFHVSVLGEVNMPGKITMYQTKPNLMQVLALAGDITDFGNRRKIKIIRKRKNVVVSELIDLTDENILASEYFYLKPGDIIYVPPTSLKTLELNLSPWRGVLTVVGTSAILLVRIFTSLL